MSSFTPDRASSLPEVLTPIMPDSIVVNISVPSSSVGIETPRNDIVSTTSSNTTDDTHTRIEIVLGRLSLDMNLRTELGLSMGSLQLVISRCDNVWSQVTMYLGRSQKSLRKNWISKDMIGSHLHQRLRTSTGRSLRSDSIGI